MKVAAAIGACVVFIALGCAESVRDRHYEAHARVVQPSRGDGTWLTDRSGRRIATVNPSRP